MNTPRKGHTEVTITDEGKQRTRYNDQGRPVLAVQLGLEGERISRTIFKVDYNKTEYFGPQGHVRERVWTLPKTGHISHTATYRADGSKARTTSYSMSNRRPYLEHVSTYNEQGQLSTSTEYHRTGQVRFRKDYTSNGQLAVSQHFSMMGKLTTTELHGLDSHRQTLKHSSTGLVGSVHTHTPDRAKANMVTFNDNGMIARVKAYNPATDGYDIQAQFDANGYLSRKSPLVRKWVATAAVAASAVGLLGGVAGTVAVNKLTSNTPATQPVTAKPAPQP